jgi:Arc/MetJ-type ribon-helix-helix transcriptional regulator
MTGKRFETVSVPVELLEEVERVVEERKNGYTSVAEFVRDAVREKLQEIQGIDRLGKLLAEYAKGGAA